MGVVIAEIHPFTDGNGRISRAMMNAELTFANQCRIIIPTGGRDDYLLALRAFSRQERAEPIIKVLAKCQALTSMVIWAPRGLSKLSFADWERLKNLLMRGFLCPRQL